MEKPLHMPPDTQTPTHRRGCLKFFVLTLLFLPAALLLFGLVSRRTGPARIEQFKADLKARGYATSPRDLVRVGVPDEENAAVLWRRALQLPWQSTEMIGMFAWKVTEDPGMLTGAQKQEVLDALDANQAALEELKRIAECPHFTWEKQDFSKAYHEWKQPQLTGISDRYRFLLAAAALLAHEGNVDRAIEMWTLGVRSSRHLVDTPYDLLALMLGSVFRGISHGPMDQVFRNRSVETEDLLQAIRVLEPKDWQSQMIHVLHIARCQDLDLSLAIINGQYEGNVLLWDGGIAFGKVEYLPKTRHWVERATISLSSPQLVSELINLHEQYIHWIETLESPPSQWQRGRTASEAEFSEEGYPLLRMLGYKPTYKGLMGIEGDVLQSVQQTQVARTALACKAFHNEEGRWPETLGEVAPEYIDPVPVDLYVDKPLVYHPREDGFVVYSVGKNQTNDAGREDDLAWEESVSTGPSEE